MDQFQIIFSKFLTNSSGHPFKCLQGEVTINDARSPQRALEAAEAKFARLKGVGDWTLRADIAELACGDRPTLVHHAADKHPVARHCV